MSDYELERTILNVLEQFAAPASARDIAESIYGERCRRKVNPTLYRLLNQGKVTKVDGQPPLWELAE